MEKDIVKNQAPETEQKKDIQVYESVSSFIKDKEGIQMYRRAEKICKAYFLLTQHIQNNDSIKTKLRTLALDMSSKTLDLVASINKTDDLARDVVMKAMALVSVSDIAVSAQLINLANYGLVVSQVHIFVEEVETYWKTLSYNNQAIPTHLFEMDDLDASYKNSRTLNLNTSEDLHTSKEGKMSFSGNAGLVEKKSDYNKESFKKAKIGVSTGHSRDNVPTVQIVGLKNDRQTLILNTIKNRGESSIKDLVDVIKGCSEKTIQRELISLVNSGDLLKTGERRWSRYTATV